MNKEKIKRAFADWPSTNRFWVTSDSECFFTEPKAINHAARLTDKRVALIRKKDIDNLDILNELEERANSEISKEPVFSTEATGEAPLEKVQKPKSTKKTK